MTYHNRGNNLQCPKCQHWDCCKLNGVHTTKAGKVQRIYCKLCRTNVDQYIVKQGKKRIEDVVRWV